MYWAIVTITTVGFGDLTPQTSLGRFLASLLMLLGYAILAVPTGIMSSELLRADRENPAQPEITPPCGTCGAGAHAGDAVFCRRCGSALG
jgi:voltage-gated potassium channel